MLAVHRSRFVHASSSTIVHIASLGKLIAVARSNGNIELWTDMYHSQTISGSPANPIESLVLVKGHEGPRLFAAGLEGVIIDYCLTSLGQKYVAHSMGGPIWCMRLDPTGKTLAIGCEDGACRLFEITQTGLEFKSSIERQKSRVMSLAWHPCGTKLALGSIKGSIRTVCCKTTRTITRMTVDSRSDEKTVIWDLLCLADGTIVSADSLGNVSFFDFDGAIIRLVKGHEADVLCLAANAAGTRVFSSGVDRKILEITNDAGEWIVSGQKRYHSHDVRALFYREQRPYDQLISGGVDNSLIFSGPCTEFETMKQQRMPTYPHKAPVSIARNARLVLARFEDNLKLWMFGTFRESGQQVVDHQRLEGTHHRHLLTVNFKVIWSLTQGKHNIVASAISDDGKWICASDGLENRLYHLVYDEFSIPTVKRVHDLPQIAAAHQILFTRNSQTLVLGCSDSNVYLISLDSRSIALEYGFHRDGREPNGVWTRAGITSLATSFDGQWLVVGDSLNRHSFDSVLPNFNAITTSIQFHPKRNVVGVTLSSNLFFFYDIDQRNITSWSQKNSQLIPAHLVDRTEPIMGMVFDTVRDEHVILFGASFILTVDLTKPVLKDHPLFHSRKQQAFLIDHRFQNIMHIDVIRAEKGSSQPGDCAELVVFERPQLDFIKELPQPFNKQKYGT